MARMRILTTSEQDAFDNPPLFDHKGRKRYFDLPKPLLDTATELRSPASQIGFLVMCAYFKVAKKGFNTFRIKNAIDPFIQPTDGSRILAWRAEARFRDRVSSTILHDCLESNCQVWSAPLFAYGPKGAEIKHFPNSDDIEYEGQGQIKTAK